MDPAALRDTLLDYTIRTLWAAVVVVIALVLARAVRTVTMRRLTRHRAQANATILLGNLAQLGVIVLGVLIVLAIYTQGAFGWILTSFSVIGIVIGLSLQDILRNFFAGAWVLVERPFRIGDSIDVSGYTGLVEEISFRTTQLRTADGRQVIIPNGDFMTKPVVNLTRFPLRRGVVFLTLGAASELSTEAVQEAIASVSAIARDPAPTVELRRVVNGKARYQVTFWAADHDAAVAAAIAVLRTHFPEGDVRGA
jgi:small-conductance mechanosensitive channel